MTEALDFERPLVELRHRLEAVEKQIAAHETPELLAQRDRLREELDARTHEIYGRLSRWQKVQVARVRARPQTLDYLKALFADFVELHGDRRFGDDPAVVGGPARLDGRVVMVVGHQRGHDTRESVNRNFGSPHPEGYRKALRLFRTAEKYRTPLITFVDTPGAWTALPDEERGQAWALAENIGVMADLRTPIVSLVIGEGGSGGALALSVADRLLMLEHAVYSVAPSEQVANILWKDPKLAPLAAEAVKLTAQDLLDLGIVDRVIPEPPGGAHSDYLASAEAVRSVLQNELDRLDGRDLDELLAERYEKYRRIGAV